jgi:hypothetical protein
MTEEITHYNGVNSALVNGNTSQAGHHMRSNGFHKSASTDALVAKARAEIEARYTMAMNRPRNLDMVRALLLAECRRPGFAESAIYHKPVGDGIEGLSIRFAETAARCFTNLVMETSQIFDDEYTRVLRVTVTDLESNMPWSTDITVDKTVERRSLGRNQVPLSQRTNSYGDMVYVVQATDEQVSTKQNALVSKTLRTLILRVIPGNLQDEALAVCRKVLTDKQATDPNSSRNAVFDAFAAIGVLPLNLEEWLGHKLDHATPAELNQLRGLYAAIRDGEATWSDAMEHRREKNAKKLESKSENSDPSSSVLDARGTAALRDAIRKKRAPQDADVDRDA